MNIRRNIGLMIIFFILVFIQIISPMAIGYDTPSDMDTALLDDFDFYYYDIRDSLPTWFYNMFNDFYGYLDRMSSEIPGIDKLKKLYHVLKNELPGQKATYSGYTGFYDAQKSGYNYKGYILRVEPLR